MTVSEMAVLEMAVLEMAVSRTADSGKVSLPDDTPPHRLAFNSNFGEVLNDKFHSSDSEHVWRGVYYTGFAYGIVYIQCRNSESRRSLHHNRAKTHQYGACVAKCE